MPSVPVPFASPLASPAIASRLPGVGTTIFTVMSRMAQESGAVNLSQGFPDFQCDRALFDAVHQAMLDGRNQYAPMAGLPELRQAIAGKVQALYGRAYDPETEVTVTAGATQALFTAIACVVGPGDEVIVFEPVYDSYGPAVETVGGRVVPLRLSFPGYRYDWDAVRAAITPRTKMIIVNSPHNPTGTLLTPADLDALAEVTRDTDIVVLSDEVYEHITYDAPGHCSLAGHPELAARTLVVSSFGKTYHITGWKVGYVVAPAPLTAEFRKVHQFNVFTVHTPSQAGLAQFMADASRHLGLAAFYRQKRDAFRALLADTGFELLSCPGTYFQLARYDAISSRGDREFAEWLTRTVGVAVIPVSAFYHDGFGGHVIRFCFAKQEATLAAAAERLWRIPGTA